MEREPEVKSLERGSESCTIVAVSGLGGGLSAKYRPCEHQTRTSKCSTFSTFNVTFRHQALAHDCSDCHLLRRCRCFFSFRTGRALVLLTRGGRSLPGDVVLLAPFGSGRATPKSPKLLIAPLQAKLQSGRCLHIPRLQSTMPLLSYLHHCCCKEDGGVDAVALFTWCVFIPVCPSRTRTLFTRLLPRLRARKLGRCICQSAVPMYRGSSPYLLAYISADAEPPPLRRAAEREEYERYRDLRRRICGPTVPHRQRSTVRRALGGLKADGGLRTAPQRRRHYADQVWYRLAGVCVCRSLKD